MAKSSVETIVALRTTDSSGMRQISMKRWLKLVIRSLRVDDQDPVRGGVQGGGQQ